MLRITVELRAASKSDPDIFEAEAIRPHITECGALVVFVGNERESYAYAPGQWDGYTVGELVGDDLAAE